MSVEAGWEALARGAWDEALTELVPLEDEPEALEGVGLAAWWLDDAEATLDARDRAFRLYRQRGDAVAAARVAAALAWDSVLFGGRAAVAQGWLERSRRLLADLPPCPEHAWLAVREAEVALFVGEVEAGLEAAGRAIALGCQLHLEEVEIVGRSLEGVALVSSGAVSDGMRRLDESAAAATGGDVTDLMWIGKVCCNLISACESAGDFERAAQWCDEVKEFARRWELRTLFNVCRTQYASILVRRGTWVEAEAELAAARSVFARSRRLAAVEGTVRLGELRRRQGRLDEAAALFADTPGHPLARIGMAEIALAESRPDDATGLAEQLLRSIPSDRRLDRVVALELAARCTVASGEMERAEALVLDLDDVAEEVGTTGSLAAAAHAGGVVALARGDLALAVTRLEDAVDLYGRAASPFEETAARRALAWALRADGREQAAVREEEAARQALGVLMHPGVATTVGGVESGKESPLDRRSSGILTTRELDVLRLVSAGRSNREIASVLVLSEHTVHRHVANILRKLGEPTRAAAAACATRDGLL